MTASEMRSDLAKTQLWVWGCMESKGFHDGRTNDDDDTLVRNTLIGTEISEAIQEVKRHWTDTPSEELKDKVAEELADVAIRLFDVAGCLGLNLSVSEWFRKEETPNRDDLFHSLGMLQYITSSWFGSVSGLRVHDSDSVVVAAILQCCDGICAIIDRDLFAAVERKMVKNMARPHKYGTPEATTLCTTQTSMTEPVSVS